MYLILLMIADQLQDAVKTSVTQLRIDPKNEVAKMNKAYYQRMPGISNKDYIERKVRVRLMEPNLQYGILSFFPISFKYLIWYRMLNLS